MTWIVTALGGLFLLAIWLIEYDPDFQRAAATRLPVPLISGHVVLALGGLAVWILYLLTGQDTFAWATLADLAVVVTLGMTMAIRWIGVYRAKVIGTDAAVLEGVGVSTATGVRRGARGASAELAVPPERHFPVS